MGLDYEVQNQTSGANYWTT